MIYNQEIIKERLLKVGVEVDSIYDLVNTNEKYPQAIDTLISLLNENIDFNQKIKEGIVRSLAVKEAKGKANDVLFKLYELNSEDLRSLNWAIGNTIYIIVQPKDEEKIIEIVKDKSKGTARQMFVSALGKLKSDAVEKVLIDLLDDEDVRGHAISALGKLKSLKAASKISTFLDHDNSWIRKVAKKALKKIG